MRPMDPCLQLEDQRIISTVYIRVDLLQTPLAWLGEDLYLGLFHLLNIGLVG